MRHVIIHLQPVELYKLLKFEGLVDSGGMAKMVIDAGDVFVNGEIEMRKRRKLYDGDIVEFADEKLCLQLDNTSSTGTTTEQAGD